MSFTPPPFTDILGQSYASLPQESQLLLATSILGISPSWLSQSFLLDAQKPNRLLANSLNNNDNANTPSQKLLASPVVVVSFMNDFEYYKSLVRRMGIDLQTLTQRKQFAFIDCLSNLFSTSSSSSSSTPSLDQFPTAISNNTQLSNIQKAIEAAIHSVSSSSNPITTTTTTSPAPSRTPQIIHQTQAGIKPRLIIEYPDILCSAGCIPAQEVVDMLLDVRDLCAVTMVVVSTDDPFVMPMLEGASARTTTELERNSAALVGTLGHVADAVVGLRRLDTGVAEDVTGVIRVTRGGSGSGGGGGGGVEEREVLYYVGDRDVKMFGRGENV